MANYADTVLKIYGKDASIIADEMESINNDYGCILSGQFIRKIKPSFTKLEKPLSGKSELIEQFLHFGDVRFEFNIANHFDDYLEIYGESAWREPEDFISLLEDLYDVKVYHLVYEPTNEIFETNDIKGNIFDYEYALDSTNYYGAISEKNLLKEANDHFNKEFEDTDDLWNYYKSNMYYEDLYDDDDYFYLLKINRYNK